MIVTFKKLLGWSGAFCLAVAAMAWAFWPRAVDVEVAPVVQGPFESTVDEEGKTRLRDRYMISAPLSGRLTRISLREGDTVLAGAPVATLTPTLAPFLDPRRASELQARLMAARDNAKRAAAMEEGAKLGVQQALNDAKRSEELARQGFVSESRLTAERLTLQAAQKTLEAARAEHRMALHDVEQASAALAAVRGGDSSAPFHVQAPMKGQVTRVLQPSEADVTIGTPLLELGDLSQIEIVAELLTTDAVRVHPGALVHIERWGGEGRLSGRVRRIEPGGFTKISALGVEEQRVRVLMDIASPQAQWQGLGDGFRVDVRIVDIASPSAVQVPVSALFPKPDGTPGMAVFVVEQGRARLHPLTLKARNGTHAWVMEGLAPDAKVIVYPPSETRDGVRVAVRRP